GFIIPISNWAVLGTVEIIEQAIDDKNFYMQFEMKHPVFGKTFAYSGTFHIS
ncbi:MAG: DUF4166 domain-containing protein, partial [Gammaproteobacteria bacterium]|nr:DUF4166 domain-containing protein [Gammaproteobacteria bacterium]